MSSAPPITIAGFLAPSGSFDDAVWGRLEPALTPLRIAVGALSEKFPWSSVKEEIGTKITGLLDVEISDVVAAAWSKAQELREYADPEKHPPEETVITELAEHTIKADYHPSLEFLVNGRELPGIQLDVLLSLVVKGLIVTIRGGELREIKSCTIAGKGKLEIAGVPILERESEPFELPGRKRLGDL